MRYFPRMRIQISNKLLKISRSVHFKQGMFCRIDLADTHKHTCKARRTCFKSKLLIFFHFVAFVCLLPFIISTRTEKSTNFIPNINIKSSCQGYWEILLNNLKIIPIKAADKLRIDFKWLKGIFRGEESRDIKATANSLQYRQWKFLQHWERSVKKSVKIETEFDISKTFTAILRKVV